MTRITWQAALLGTLAAMAAGGCEPSQEVAPLPGGPGGAADGAGSEDTATVAAPPILTVTSPARGEWLVPGAPVQVAGTAVATTAAVSRVLVGPAEVTVAGDAFQTTVSPVPGVNVIGIRAEAEDGERTVDGRAFFSGEVHAPGATIPGAVVMHLRPEFLDDDDPALDDLAGVTESLLSDPAVLGIFDAPFSNTMATITPTEVSIGSAAVDIVPEAGQLHMSVALQPLSIRFDLKAHQSLGQLIDGTGRLSATAAHLSLRTTLGRQAEGLTAEVVEVDVVLEGFAFEHDKYPNFEQDYPSLAAALMPALKTWVEETLEETLSSLISDLLVRLIGGFAFEQTLGTDHPVSLRLALADVEVGPHGMTLTLDARVSAPIGAGVALHPRSGSLRTENPMPDLSASPARIAIAVDDDVTNQVLYALWHSGFFANIDLGPADLATYELADLPQVFQPLARLTSDLRLPITLRPRGGDERYLFDLAAGELQLRLETSTGKAFAVSVNAVDGIGFEVANGMLQLHVDARPAELTMHVACTEAPPGIDPGSVAALLRVGLPPVLESAAAAFELPLPGIPLTTLFDTPALVGRELGFSELTARVAGAQVLVLEGRAVVRTVPPRP